MRNQNHLVAAVLVTCAGWTAGGAAGQVTVSADGVIESTSGGFKFPDGSVQTSAAADGVALVERTGWALCFDENGDPRDCAGTGEDGDHQAGVAWPLPRFTDLGDGTVADNLTGLTWLKDANCLAANKTWQEALDWIDDTLNSGGTACSGYTAGTFTDWRLANIRELLSLADYTQTDPALPSGHPFESVQTEYWSSTSQVSSSLTAAWTGNIFSGTPLTLNKDDSLSASVWPVRGGQ